MNEQLLVILVAVSTLVVFVLGGLLLVANFSFDELVTKRADLQDKIIEVIGRDLNGYMLDDVAIDRVERAPEGHDGPFR